MSLSIRLTLALVGLLTLLGTHWRAYTLGARHERDAVQAAQTEAVHQGAVAAIQQANNTIEVIHARTQTQTRITTDRLAVSSELDRLRNDLQAVRAAATGGETCTADSAAQNQLLAAMARDLATLGEQGAAIAAAADGHAADALMLWRIAKPGAVPD